MVIDRRREEQESRQERINREENMECLMTYWILDENEIEDLSKNKEAVKKILKKLLDYYDLIERHEREQKKSQLKIISCIEAYKKKISKVKEEKKLEGKASEHIQFKNQKINFIFSLLND